jgi:CRP-like cAMP-binding protein
MKSSFLSLILPDGNKIMKALKEISALGCRDCRDKSCATSVLNEQEMDIIFNNRYVSEIKKRTNILNEGSPISHIMYLRTGLVKEYVIRPDNQEQILQIIKPHSYLGLTSLFGDKINHFSYEALTDLKLCYIDIEIFTNLIRNNGRFAFEILTSVGRDSLTNFHRFINQSHKKIYGRVADILIYFSKIVFDSTTFQIPLSRLELAEMIGTSRESAGRVIARFSSEGIITTDGKTIVINDMKKLENISKFG